MRTAPLEINSPRFIRDVKYLLDLFHIYCYHSLIFALTLHEVTFSLTPKQYQLNIQESKTNKTPQHCAHTPCSHPLYTHTHTHSHRTSKTAVSQLKWGSIQTWSHPSSAFPSPMQMHISTHTAAEEGGPRKRANWKTWLSGRRDRFSVFSESISWCSVPRSHKTHCQHNRGERSNKENVFFSYNGNTI